MATESYDPSYYDVLGVPEDAASHDVGRAIMRAMRDAHPDAHADADAASRADAEERARLLTEAHGVLTGPDRAGYDARLAAWRGEVLPETDAVVTDPGPVDPFWDQPAEDAGPAARESTPLADVDGPTDPVEEEPILPAGAPDLTVLPLSRDRWLRGGRLTPLAGGSPIDVPARTDHHELLVYEGRGAPGPDGHPGDLHVRVVHVDPAGEELTDGHLPSSGSGAVADVVRRMTPADAALVALGLLVAIAAVVVLFVTR